MRGGSLYLSLDIMYSIDVPHACMHVCVYACSVNHQLPVSFIIDPPLCAVRPSPASTASMLQFCQQFLVSQGFSSAAEALADLRLSQPVHAGDGTPSAATPSSNTQQQLVKTTTTGDASQDAFPPEYIQFRRFVEWIDHGLESLRVSRAAESDSVNRLCKSSPHATSTTIACR